MDAGLISTCCNSVPDSADQWLSQAYTIWDPDDSLYGCASEVRPPCVHPAVLLTAGAVIAGRRAAEAGTSPTACATTA